VLDDPLLQRVMMTVIVNPEKIQAVNVAGAFALQKYLTSPQTQARIRAFRYPNVPYELFWPASRDNIGTFLSDNAPIPTTADAAVNNIIFDSTTVRVGGTLGTSFVGTNLSADTYFDVRFRRPGATSDDVAENWQQGPSGMHQIPTNTPTGVWRITGVRAHRDAGDHSASVIPVTATLTTAP